jgi:transcriptional regulator with XRE-family HTH domain
MSDSQTDARPAEEAGTKKHQMCARPVSGRKPAYESRAAEFRQTLIIWKQTPESMRLTLRALATRLGTNHQLLSHYLNGLDRWKAYERAKRIRAEGNPFKAGLVEAMADQIEKLNQAARRGPLNSHEVNILRLFVKQEWPGAKEILEKCRRMTPAEEKQVRAFERKATFSSAALKNIERIKQAMERGPLPWRDIEILKILARRKCAGAKELLQKYSKSALPRP